MNKSNTEILESFLEYLRIEKGYSSNTILAYKIDIETFINFLEKEDFGDINEVSEKIASFYLAYLRDNYTPKSIQRKVSSLNTLYNRLVDTLHEAERNPFKGITLPKIEKRLPKFIYESEIKDFFSSIDTTTIYGKRDKLIFSLLLQSGLRVSELSNMKLKDLNIRDKVLSIHGKGSKDRLVPISNQVKEEFDDYLKHTRLVLLSKSDNLDNDSVFLNFKGTSLTSRGVRDILSRIIKDASLTLKISPHTFRHTFATNLLNNGMDVRMVQELLGHSNLSTTQIYTKVSKENLYLQYSKAFPKGDKKDD